MINDSELNISNLSYTNKDFETAYAEILGIATELSKRWNPSTSNESDPGVVLLKLLAFFVDKLNYNLDKNTLENFLLSCTQETSMRDLCEMNGYSPRYYTSATTRLSFMYTGYKEDSESEDALSKYPGDNFTLPAFSTDVEDSESNVSYVLIEPVTISEKNREVTALAIQGSFKYITIENSDIIKLANLDDNNRIYFPISNVAENGIFIFNANNVPDSWTQVKNLNTVVPGTRAFRFGFDSIENLPYIEFTDDISQLIGSGIKIGYVVTSGVTGNVKANYLTQLKNLTEVTTINGVTIPLATENSECLSITNKSESTNGADPETINEAYNSFKKTVGTFNTLVSCRDYANAIYNLMDDASLPLVSNCQVSDRRTDINYANRVLTHDKFGKYIKNVSTDIDSFDICLYPLTPIKYSYNPDSFNNSFTPLEGKYFEIENKIEDNKCLAHVYREMSEIAQASRPEEYLGKIYLYKVYYKLNARINTKQKVNSFQQIDILANIYDAIYKNFNARKIDYGYEIPYDTILSIIQNADKRIKYVVLDEPELKTKVMLNNGLWVEEDLISTNNNNYAHMLAKNIVAGSVPMFEYNTDFDYEYGESTISRDGQVLGPTFKNIKSVTSLYKVPIESGEDYDTVQRATLGRNEVLQLVSPSYSTSLSYVSGVAYSWRGLDTHSSTESGESGSSYESGASIDAQTVSKTVSKYKIKPGEVLKIYYEQDDNTYIVTYTSDEVTKQVNNGTAIQVSTGPNYIKPVGFDLEETESKTSGVTYYINETTGEVVTHTYNDEKPAGTYNYVVLSSDQSIDIKAPVKTIHKEKALPCYWLLNNKDNKLFTASNKVSEYTDASNVDHYVYERILIENEYFMWSDESLSDLEVIGSGTKLRYDSLTEITAANDSAWAISTDEGPTAEEVSEAGLAAFAGYPWKYIDFSREPLELMQMDILTLTEGDTFQAFNVEKIPGNNYLNNKFIKIVSGDINKFSYTLLEDGTQSSIDLTDSDWEVKSRFDLDAGPYDRQYIDYFDSVSIEVDGEQNLVELHGCYIKFNTYIQLVGGDNLDMRNTDTSSSDTYPLKLYIHDYTAPTYETTSYTKTLKLDQNNELVIPYSNLDTTNPIILPLVNIPECSSLISLYNSSDTATVTVSTVDGSDLKFYYDDEAEGSSVTLAKGVNVIETSAGISISVVLSPESGQDISGQLTISSIKEASGLNSRFFENNLFEKAEWTTAEINNLKDAIKEKVIEFATYDNYNLFDYTATLEASKQIEVEDLASPLAMFDVNNVCNKFTIAEIALASNQAVKDEEFYSTIDVARSCKI